MNKITIPICVDPKHSKPSVDCNNIFTSQEETNFDDVVYCPKCDYIVDGATEEERTTCWNCGTKITLDK